MGHVIAVSGKGGVGKTTLCGLLIQYLCESGKRPVLAVDADANANLNEVLGVEPEITLGELREEIERAGVDPRYQIPAGMTKQAYLEMRLSDAIAEEDDYDLMVMGRTQGQGCYCFVNGLVQTQVQKLQSHYPYIVVDNEAGMEHISRGILPMMEVAILVSDCSRRGVQAAGRIAKLMKELKPDVVFSKGGFVSVPVVLAASAKKIPCIIHESDMTPGLANKISIPKASKVCCNFAETMENLPAGKAVVTGTPIRQELFAGDAVKAMTFCGFTEVRPTLLVIGGSSGSVRVNEAIRSCLPELTKKYNVIHLCGKGNIDESYNGTAHYVQFDYIKQELADLLALADIVVSRAGANAICELLALRKPSVLIPLSLAASRGDQILNAQSFDKRGYAKLLLEEDLTNESLLAAVNEVYENHDHYIKAMELSTKSDAITMICDMIDELANK